MHGQRVLIEEKGSSLIKHSTHHPITASVVACVIIALFSWAPIARAQDPAYVYSIPNTLVGSGGCFQTSMLLDSSAGRPLRGWQVAVCHDPTRLATVSVERGAAYVQALYFMQPWFDEITFAADGWNAGAVIDQQGLFTLLPGSNLELYALEYDALLGGSATTLEFCTLATTGPAISAAITTDLGATITPTVISGAITITAAPGDCNDLCVDATPVGDGTFPYHLGATSPDGPGLALPCGVLADRDVWYCYTATCDGFGKIEMAGNGFAAVYDGCGCPATVNGLLACGALGPASGGAQLTFPVFSGAQYLVQVGTSLNLPGSTSGSVTFACELPDCVLPNNGAGTVDLPPVGCTYSGAGDFHVDAMGMPEALLNLSVTQGLFSAISGPSAGGSLSGDTVTYNSQLLINVEGFGTFAGYSRFLSLTALASIVDLAPRPGGAALQGFETALQHLNVELTGDPDFDLLRITAGGNNALPSPGFTTARLLPSGSYAVDSFFDVTYEIVFVGAAGGPLAGRSGITTDTVRVQLGNGVSEVPRFVRGDANVDGALNVGDTIAVLAQLFSAAPQICRDASDANDDGSLNLADPVFILGFLFQGGGLPPAPGLVCGEDPTADTLDCGDDSACP